MLHMRILMLIFVAGCLMFGPGAAHAFTTLRLGHEHPVDSPFHLGALRFAQLVAEKTEGNLRVDVYGNGIIAGEPGLASGIRNGTVDMALLSAGNVVRFNPDFLLFDLPYLFRDYGHVERVLTGEVGKSLAAKLETNGIRVLSYWESGFRHFSNNVHAVHEPEDLHGLKIRTPNWPGVVELVDTLGAISRPMPFDKMYGALKQGDVDGQEEPVFVLKAAKLYEVQKYLTLDGHTYVPVVLGMHPRRFKNLPHAYQIALTKAAEEAGFYERRLVRDQFEQDLLFLRQEGKMGITRVTDKTLWIAASKRVYEHLGMRINKKLIEKVQGM